MPSRPALLSCLMSVAAVLAATRAGGGEGTEKVLPVANGGFEEGLKGWKLGGDRGMSSVSSEQAASGARSLKVVDSDGKFGSNAVSTRVSVAGGGVYELRGKVYPVSGTGLGVYVRVLDKDGGLVVPGDTYIAGLGGSEKRWKSFSRKIYTTRSTAFLEIWVHSYSHARVVAYLDDLHFASLGAAPMTPPWKGQYKIKPNEEARLTPADVVGPDGIVYPNWTRCGVQGGIPEVKAAARIEDFGGKADDDKDDAAALQAACDSVGEKGGGAVVLGAGTYYLDRPVTVWHDGVVIRGAGMEKTKLIFRYAVDRSGVGFYTPEPGSRVGRATSIEIHCRPKDLAKITLYAGDTVITSYTRSKHSGNTFFLSTDGRRIVGKVPDGPQRLRAVAEYRGGGEFRAEIPVVVDSGFNDPGRVAYPRAAITFAGRGWQGEKLRLARDGKRGDLKLELRTARGLRPGDLIMIDGPATQRWKKLTQNACRWGSYRRYEVTIEKIEGNTLTIEQPLRIEFPVVDGSYVQKMVPIRRCGIEDLYIEQTENLWITTVLFRHGWNCWARGVKVKMCGRNPVYGYMAKWCEIRDCVFDDAWFKGGGGTAYTGWEVAWDCLMENVETFRMRHAPLVQWSASGNVIRKGVFHESDAQWHSGWTNENLFEQCVVKSVRGHGGYGYGMWGSPPEDTAHGPNGPRNVVYNCDVTSQRDGLWMGGMNENWLVLHNRFVVDKGRGVYARTASFDHIIKGNVFVLKDGKSPMVFLGTADCVGIELVGNVLYGGSGKFLGGAAELAVDDGNRAVALGTPHRPKPAVPSIYEWQKNVWLKKQGNR